MDWSVVQFVKLTPNELDAIKTPEQWIPSYKTEGQATKGGGIPTVMLPPCPTGKKQAFVSILPQAPT